MDSPTSRGGDDSTTRIASRSSMIESFKGCGLTGLRIDKEDLRKKLQMPQYLRFAMRDSIRLQDPTAGESRLPGTRLDSISASTSVPETTEQPPDSPMVVFINPRSGGRHGRLLKDRLQMLISEEQVFDLTDVKPHEFVRYGLGCLELLAELGDACAKDVREKMRVMVAGGDGTVGWVLGCLLELEKKDRRPVPPVGVIPLGTGNDLSRTFGWGGSFPFAWKSAIKRSLDRATTGQIRKLDSWHVFLSTPSGENGKLPHCMKPTEELALDESLEIEEALSEKASCYEGVFYNYFSIGMDAQVAYGFHNLRNEKPYLAQGPIANKVRLVNNFVPLVFLLHASFPICISQFFLNFNLQSRDIEWRWSLLENLGGVLILYLWDEVVKRGYSLSVVQAGKIFSGHKIYEKFGNDKSTRA